MWLNLSASAKSLGSPIMDGSKTTTPPDSTHFSARLIAARETRSKKKTFIFGRRSATSRTLFAMTGLKDGRGAPQHGHVQAKLWVFPALGRANTLWTTTGGRAVGSSPINSK